MHLCNCYRKHTTIEETSRHVMDNYNYKIWMEKVAFATEKSRKIYQERSEYNEDDVVLLTNWISKVNIKKPYFKSETKKELRIKELRDVRLKE